MKNAPVPIPAPNKIASSIENVEQSPVSTEVPKQKIETVSHQSVQPKEVIETEVDTKAPIVSLIQEKSGGRSEGISGVSTEEIERFCSNIGSQAADARFQLQRKQLQELRDQISERVKILEEKQNEYQIWLNKRNEFLSMAESSLVEIITKMRPDAAAAQLALMNDLVAASLVLKLSPKVSSAIMNELPPEKSAELTQILVSAQQASTKKK
ncbi:MotE family protein [Bartonella sp. Raccoon60]|uniref:MotE family protein n=1 Tax=Bartonella sp. Raccoon60 TaxID=1933912 RepID=UPI001F2C2DD4|nr:MotE family protein [Bartonella sp. Raccoon60]